SSVFHHATFVTVIYTLSLHAALPILDEVFGHKAEEGDMTEDEYREYYKTGYETDTSRIDIEGDQITFHTDGGRHTGRYVYDGYEDRKSTRLNSSHVSISYAVFCLKKK